MNCLFEIDTDKLSLLSSRLEAAEQELINAELDKKLAAINSAKISQVSLETHLILIDKLYFIVMIGLSITFFTGSINQQTKRGYQNIDKRCKKYRSDTAGTSGRMLEEN